MARMATEDFQVGGGLTWQTGLQEAGLRSMPEEDRQMSEVCDSAGAAEVEREASGWALRFICRPGGAGAGAGRGGRALASVPGDVV